jgi:hypothetical protein
MSMVTWVGLRFAPRFGLRIGFRHRCCGADGSGQRLVLRRGGEPFTLLQRAQSGSVALDGVTLGLAAFTPRAVRHLDLEVVVRGARGAAVAVAGSGHELLPPGSLVG